jgi:hypothetical protein
MPPREPLTQMKKIPRSAIPQRQQSPTLPVHAVHSVSRCSPPSSTSSSISASIRIHWHFWLQRTGLATRPAKLETGYPTGIYAALLSAGYAISMTVCELSQRPSPVSFLS